MQSADPCMEGCAERQSVDGMLPGPIPEQSANAIEVLLLTWVISTGDHTRTCLETSKVRAREAVDLFLSDDSPLPGSVDRRAELSDGARFPEVYRSFSGGDDLMWGLWRLSHATDRQSGR